MLSNLSRQPEVNPMVPFNSDKANSNNLIKDVKVSHSNSVSFTDEALKKIINEEVDSSAVYRRINTCLTRELNQLNLMLKN